MSNIYPPVGERFQHFIHAVEAALDRDGSSEGALLPLVSEAMQGLVTSDDWLPDCFAQPHPKFYQQYLLHLDPAKRFSVVSFVWGPGQCTPIHDHRVWGVIGVLRGGEVVEHYDVEGTDHVKQRGNSAHLKPGDIGLVSPTIGDVHRVRNAFADRVSVSIHVYGADIGTVSRSVYSPQGEARKSFISGYANAPQA